MADGDLELLKRRLRAALESAGVTGLRSEVQVRSASGALAYLDLVHDASGNALELDGWGTHSDRGRFVADRRRDRWVRREHGLVTTGVAADEVRTDLPAVVDELLPLFCRTSAAPCAAPEPPVRAPVPRRRRVGLISNGHTRSPGARERQRSPTAMPRPRDL